MPSRTRPVPRRLPPRSKLAPRYRVEYEGGPRGYAIRDERGIVEYDWIEDEAEARLICEALDRGIGPDWDAVSDELGRMKAARSDHRPSGPPPMKASSRDRHAGSGGGPMDINK